MGYAQNMSFEAEVRRIAEVVWSLSPGECQPSHYPGDPVVREVDGVARLRDVTHLIMATTSTRLDKVKGDVKKLNAAETLERQNAPAVSKWLITEKQLDAEHVTLARKSNVVALTLDQFQRRFFDGAKYLSFRARAPFGSARDPITDSTDIAPDAYVSLPMRIAFDHTGQGSSKADSHISLNQILDRLAQGQVIVLRAPFGSGKSLTTREIFQMMAKRARKDTNSSIPLTLNLREHWGEDYADEILDRHARSIGYVQREELVIAWRAGMCCLILDGFDELAAQTVVRADNKNFMRDARRRALQGVRDFAQKVPDGVGLFICGRDHYFDNETELASSLGISGRKYLIIDLDEFSEESASEFLRRNGITDALPDWLPRKPLILSYLLRSNLFSEILAIDSSKGFGYAWDHFLTRICEREAGLENSSMDPQTIRSVLERLSDGVRSKSSGTGPITGNDLAEAYAQETGQAAGEGVLAQLQRLPGLTQRESEMGSRSFVDPDMLGALQGSSFAKRVLGNFPSIDASPLDVLPNKAIAMATHMLSTQGATAETVITIAEQLSRRSQRDRVSAQVIGDCYSVATRLAADADTQALNLRGLVIDGACLDRVALDEVMHSDAEFRNCTIRELAFGEAGNMIGVYFSNCLIGKVFGVSERSGLPESLIGADCEIESFDNMTTNNAVLGLDIPPQIKALITILRKLYKQPGAGRKLGAFSRGITRQDVLRFIDPVLAILERQRFISIFNSVVHPVRKQTTRVEQILASPMLCDDEVVKDVIALGA